MNPASWRLIKSIYESALALDGEERLCFVENRCADDFELRQEIYSMLANCEQADRFFSCAIPRFPNSVFPILPPGTLLADRFSIVELLGAGGMGQVYRAEDRHTFPSQQLALKTLQSFRPHMQTLFKNEFRALSGIAHPNLVTLYELFCEPSDWFFTMELVDGCDFVDYIRGGSRQSQRDAFLQLVEGIAALHDAGKIHCDLKPSNILVTPQHRVVILDFGLVRDTRNRPWRPEATLAAGTLAYMAPEQVDGAGLSPASDWYAFGVLLYEALAARKPFSGTPDELFAQKMRGPAMSPLDAPAGAPPDLSDLATRLLHPDPSIRPSVREIREVFAASPHPARSLAAPSAGSEVFVGRRPELVALHDAFDCVRDGNPMTVFLEGPSGIGKTALVERFLKDLHAREPVLVVAGKCYEQENLPYKALDAAIDTISEHLRNLNEAELRSLIPPNIGDVARLFRMLRWLPGADAPPGQHMVDEQEVRRRAVSAFRDLLLALARTGRLVLLLDDLQWGDLDSALLVSEILTGDSAPAIMTIAIMRSEDSHMTPCVQWLLAAAKQFPHCAIRLDPLNTSEAAELVHSLLGRPSEQTVREGGGNPFFLSQLVASGGAAEPHAGGVERLVLDTAAKVPDSARQLIDIVALNGKPIPLVEACIAANVDGGNPRLLIALRSFHLARTIGSGRQIRVDTYHDRVREVLISSLAPDRKREAHLSLATALLGTAEQEAEHVGMHFEFGGDHAAAGELYRSAAEHADAALAFDHAAGLYGKALHIGTFSATVVTELHTGRANALRNAGQCLEAAESYQSAMKTAPPEQARNLLLQAAYHLCISGHLDRGRAAYEQVLAQIGMRLPVSTGGALLRLGWARLRLRLRGLSEPQRIASHEMKERAHIVWTAATALGLIDVFASAVLTTEGLLLALDSGDASLAGRFLLWESLIRGLNPRDRRDAERFRALAGQLLREMDDPYLIGLNQMASGFRGLQQCRFPQAARSFQDAEAFYRDHCRGCNWELTTSQHQWIHTIILMGEFGALGNRLPGLMREAREKGDRYSLTTLSVLPAVMNYMRLDEPSAGLDALREALANWPQQGMTSQRINALLGECWLLLHLDQPLRALKLLEDSWPEIRRSYILKQEFYRIMLYDVRARAALRALPASAARGTVWRLAERIVAALKCENSPMAAAMAAGSEAGLRAFGGDLHGAEPLFEEASLKFRRLSMNSYGWSAHRAAGILAGGEKGRVMAEEALQWLAGQSIRDPLRVAAICAPMPRHLESTLHFAAAPQRAATQGGNI
jgi:tetratricopeptide (TPR) repeat protein